jgi:hypothetical protein
MSWYIFKAEDLPEEGFHECCTGASIGGQDAEISNAHVCSGFKPYLRYRSTSAITEHNDWPLDPWIRGSLFAVRLRTIDAWKEGSHNDDITLGQEG